MEDYKGDSYLVSKIDQCNKITNNEELKIQINRLISDTRSLMYRGVDALIESKECYNRININDGIRQELLFQIENEEPFQIIIDKLKFDMHQYFSYMQNTTFEPF